MKITKNKFYVNFSKLIFSCAAAASLPPKVFCGDTHNYVWLCMCVLYPSLCVCVFVVSVWRCVCVGTAIFFMAETTTRAEQNELKGKHAKGEKQQRQKQRTSEGKKERKKRRKPKRKQEEGSASERGKCKGIPHVAQKIKMLAGSWISNKRAQGCCSKRAEKRWGGESVLQMQSERGAGGGQYAHEFLDRRGQAEIVFVSRRHIFYQYFVF